MGSATELSAEFGGAGGDGLFEFFDDFGSGFREIGSSATATSGDCCGGFDGVAGVEIFVLHEWLADGGDEGHFAIDDGSEDDCHGAVFIAQLIGEVAEGFAGDILEGAGDDANAIDYGCILSEVTDGIGNSGGGEFCNLFLQGADFLLKSFDAAGEFVGLWGFQLSLESGDEFVGIAAFLEGFGSGEGCDAADASGDGFFGHDAAESCLTGAGEVCAAAEFDAEISHGDNADFVGIFFTEECHCAAFASIFDGEQFGNDRSAAGDAGVDDIFDLVHFGGRECLVVSEVEAEFILLDA